VTTSRSSLPMKLTLVIDNFPFRLHGYTIQLCNFEMHITAVLKQCSQRMFRMLRSQGMNANHLNTVFVARDFAFVVCFACIGNVCLCWSTRQNRCFLRHSLTNVGFVKEIVTFNDLLTNSAETLFSKVQASNHCLHALLPEKRS